MVGRSIAVGRRMAKNLFDEKAGFQFLLPRAAGFRLWIGETFRRQSGQKYENLSLSLFSGEPVQAARSIPAFPVVRVDFEATQIPLAWHDSDFRELDAQHMRSDSMA